MTTYTWNPTPAHPWFLLRQNLRTYHNNRSSVSPLSGFTQTLALPGARWGWALDFPEHTYAERSQLEGFFAKLNGNEHRLAMWDMTRPRPLGNINTFGVTLAANAAQFATSLSLAGCRAGTNLLLGSSFEVDSGVSGVAAGWTSYSSGSVTSPSWFLTTTDVHGAYAQRCQATSIGTSALDRVGVQQLVPLPAGSAGLPFTFSAFMKLNTASVVLAQMYISWLNSSDVEISGATDAKSITSAMARYSLTSTAPSGAVKARVFVWFHTRSGGAGAFEANVDAAQFEQASSASSSFPGYATIKAGDWLSVGGQLLMAPADATATDAGAMTLEVRHMLRAAASSGAAVTLDKPTGLFIMAEPAMEWPRGAGNMTPETSVGLVEVFA